VFHLYRIPQSFVSEIINQADLPEKVLSAEGLGVDSLLKFFFLIFFLFNLLDVFVILEVDLELGYFKT
jgi:hypothetical protein